MRAESLRGYAEIQIKYIMENKNEKMEIYFGGGHFDDESNDAADSGDGIKWDS